MARQSKTTAAGNANAATGFHVKLDRLFAEDHRPLAVFSADNGQFAIHGIEVKHSAKGPFVQMPQVSYKSKGNTVYQDIFHPITAKARQALYDAVMDCYQEARLAEEGQEQDEEEAEDEAPGQQPAM